MTCYVSESRLAKNIAARQGHPEQFSVTMLRLATSLSAFSADLTLHRLPVYDHQDLGTCMSALDREIRLLLETVVPSRFIAIVLSVVDERTWACRIPEECSPAMFDFYLL